MLYSDKPVFLLLIQIYYNVLDSDKLVFLLLIFIFINVFDSDKFIFSLADSNLLMGWIQINLFFSC